MYPRDYEFAVKYYAGIGSRETPFEILDLMADIAEMLNTKGYILRSGGAVGADAAFAEGALWDSEIFKSEDATPSAIALASKYHPNWGACQDYAKKLHGRNTMILFGEKLDTNVECVICWTPGGKVIGGTGMGIRVAMDHNIPVYNLFHDNIQDKFRKLL
jgi:hypothetical protein